MAMPKVSARPKRKRSQSRDSGSQSEAESSPEKKRVRWEGKAGASTTEETTESDSEDPTDEKICLAAYCQNGRIGCAYYDPIKCMILVLEDTQETTHYELTTMLLEQASPDVLLTSSRSEDDFLDVARAHMDASGGVFQIRPHKEFVASKGRERTIAISQASSEIGSTSSDGVTRNAYDFMRRRHAVTGVDPTLKRWNASIRLSNFTSVESSPLCVASIGALLDHLVRERAVNDLEDEGIAGLEVRDIEALSLDQVMQINADALFSLQVFENESHASVHSDKTKEGLSLFGTLNTTKTTLGRALLRTWLLRPSLSLSVIKARHDAVACFIAAENLVPAYAMQGHLKGIKNVPRILEIMRSGKAKMSDWQGLVKFTFHSAMLRDNLSELHQAGHVEIVKKLIAALDIASFRDIGNRINEIIDWEESANAGRICVRSNVDEELDNRKHVYHGIDAVLSKVAEQICQTVPPDYASSLNIVYFPQLGFLICVPMLDEWKGPEGIQVIDGWSFQFSSESHVYFKSQEMTDMDVHIGDLHPSIVDRELEIVQELLEEIIVHFEAMTVACDISAELDVLLSFADASRAFEYRRPEMVDDNIIDIKQGRHPLQEQVVDTFVPNDAHLAGGSGNRSVLAGDEATNEAEEWNSIVLCTGANACGKSVYLKQVYGAQSLRTTLTAPLPRQVALIQYMAQVLSLFQIPNLTATCTGSVCPFFLSSSWLFLDGAGLFCGVLKHFLNRGQNCPKVLAATHFHDVFREDLLDPHAVPITFLHMQVMFTSSNGQIIEPNSSHHLVKPTLAESANASQSEPDARGTRKGEKITYLYRQANPEACNTVAEGLSMESHAAKCAEIFGVPSRIVQRAQHVSHLISTHELGRLLDEEMTDKEREDLADAEVVCRRFLKWNLEDGEGNVKGRLAEVLGRKDEDESKE
ncbi:MutS 5 [Mycena venus]|uniref:MutS 5 n=1 Tax=Mycena venus TaxID=2733690 RepID=A0A8H6YWI4_9AGAR|nr:MutS 5 [Mycena venus]